MGHLRADVARMPFATGSVDAIHAGETVILTAVQPLVTQVQHYLFTLPAGAAIHCWPNPQAALAEISRVLRPGGVFVASTFMVSSAPLGQILGNDDFVRPLKQVRYN